MCAYQTTYHPISDDSDLVNRCKVLPPLIDDKLDHDITRWLVNWHWCLLLLPPVSRNLLAFPDELEAIAIGRLAALNGNLLDACRFKVDLVDYLGRAELDCQFLWEHTSCEPVRVVRSTYNGWRQDKVSLRKGLGYLLQDVAWVKSLIKASSASDLHFVFRKTLNSNY